jgi:hypothetical protein
MLNKLRDHCVGDMEQPAETVPIYRDFEILHASLVDQAHGAGTYASAPCAHKNGYDQIDPGLRLTTYSNYCLVTPIHGSGCIPATSGIHITKNIVFDDRIEQPPWQCDHYSGPQANKRVAKTYTKKFKHCNRLVDLRHAAIVGGFRDSFWCCQKPHQNHP